MSRPANSYIPKYVKPDLEWYERDDLMTYLDRIKYEEYERDPDKYLSKANIVNLTSFIHSVVVKNMAEKFYQTIKSSDIVDMPKKDKSIGVSACLRSSRKYIFVEKKICLTMNRLMRFFNSLKKHVMKIYLK